MIQIKCVTNLDVTMEKWPTALPTAPRVGDLIESATKHGDFQLRLKVIRVTWVHCRPFDYSECSWHPFIELHDHIEGRSIREFYEWYAPLVGKSVSAFI